MVYPYDNDLPIGAVSPFGEVTMPEEAIFAADMGEVLPAPVDLSVPDVNPLTLPSAESFAEDMAQEQAQEQIDWSEAERLKQSFEALAQEQAPIPPEGEPIPLAEPDAFEQDVALVDPAVEQEFFQPFTGLGEAGVLERPEAPVVGAEEFGEELAPFEEEPVQPPIEDMSNEELELEVFRREQDRGRLINEKIAANAAEGEVALTVYEDAHRAAQQEDERILNESKEIAREGIDNNRWWSSRSSGQKIASYVSVLTKGQLGLISGRGGNEALKMIMGEIDKDIDSQKFGIQNRRAGLQQQQGLVNRIYQRSGNMYQATQTARLAALGGIEAEVDNQMSMRDPEGTDFRALEVKKRQIRATYAAEEQKLKQASRAEAARNAKDTLNARKVEAEISLKRQQVLKSQADTAKAQAEAAKLARRGTGGGQKKKYMSPKQQLEFTKQGYEPYTIGGALVPTPGADALRAQGPAVDKGEQAEEEKQIAEAEVWKAKASGMTLNDISGKPLINKDGSPAVIADAATRQKLQSMTSAAYNMRRIADLAKILRNKSGGASELIGSKEYQELTNAAAMMDFEIYKAFDLGAPSAGDQKMAADAKGGKDITSWIYDGSAGWDALANGVEDKLNTALKIEGGYTGKDIKPTREKIKPKTERTQRTLEKDILAPRLEVVDDDQNKYVDDKGGEIAAWVETNPSNNQMAKMIRDMESSGMSRAEVERFSVPMVDLFRKQALRKLPLHEQASVLREQSIEDLRRGKQFHDPGESYRLITGGE